MNLAINGRFLSQNLTGVQRVALQYTQEIKALFPNTPVYCPPSPVQKIEAENLNAYSLSAPKPYNIFWEQWALPRAARGSFLLNFGNTAPLWFKNQGLMVHDTAFMAHPRWFSRSFAAYYRFVVPRAARVSRLVMTVSAFSQNEIASYFDISKDKILVLPSWVSPVFQNLRSQGVQEKENYILAVASVEPRKNYPALLRAFSRLEGLNLKAAGGSSDIFASTPELDALMRQPRVEILGRCDDQKLAALYTKALFFCSLSFYEGFGLPPLEAMNAGCPVLVSDIPPHREVCGDAALYADPNDGDDIHRKMKLLAQSPSLRQELSLAGKQRAAIFNKSNSVTLLVEKLKEIAQ